MDTTTKQAESELEAFASTEPRPKAWIQQLTALLSLPLAGLQRSHARKHGYNPFQFVRPLGLWRFNGATPESMDTTEPILKLEAISPRFNGATPESMDTTYSNGSPRRKPRASTEPRPKAWIQQELSEAKSLIIQLQRSHARKHGYNG